MSITATPSTQGSAPLLSLAGLAGPQAALANPSPTPSPGLGPAGTGTATPSSLSRLTLSDKLLLAQAVHHIGSVPPDWGRVSALVLNHPLIKTPSRIETVSKAGFTLGRVFGSRECERAWIALMRMYGLVSQPGELTSQSQPQSQPPSNSQTQTGTQEDEDGNPVPATPKSKESRTAAPRTDKASQLQLAQLLYAERILELRNSIKEKEDKFRELVQEVEALKSGARDDALRAELELRRASEQDPTPSNNVEKEATRVVEASAASLATTNKDTPTEISATELLPPSQEAQRRDSDAHSAVASDDLVVSAPAATTAASESLTSTSSVPDLNIGSEALKESAKDDTTTVTKPADKGSELTQIKRPIPPPIKTSTEEQTSAVPAVVLTEEVGTTPTRDSPRPRNVTDGSALASPAPSAPGTRRRSTTLSASRSASPSASEEPSQSIPKQEEQAGDELAGSENATIRQEESAESPARPQHQRASSSIQKRKRGFEAPEPSPTSNKESEQSARKRTRASTNRPADAIPEEAAVEAEQPPTPSVGRPRRGGRTDSAREADGDAERAQPATGANTPVPPSTPGPSKQLRRSGRASLAGEESVPPTPVSAGPTRSTRSRKASPTETREAMPKVESEDEQQQQRAGTKRERSESTLAVEEPKDKEDVARRASASLSPVSSRRPSRGAGGGRGRASSVASRDSGRERSSGPGAKKDDKEKARRKREKMLLMLLDEVSNHTHGNLFHNPIKEQDAPDYYQLVRHPLDLKTIRSKVKEGRIVNSAQLRRALNHMFANSLIYNRPGTEVHRMATEMRDAAEIMVDQFEQTQQMSRR